MRQSQTILRATTNTSHQRELFRRAELKLDLVIIDPSKQSMRGLRRSTPLILFVVHRIECLHLTLYERQAPELRVTSFLMPHPSGVLDRPVSRWQVIPRIFGSDQWRKRLR